MSLADTFSGKKKKTITARRFYHTSLTDSTVRHYCSGAIYQRISHVRTLMPETSNLFQPKILRS